MPRPPLPPEVTKFLDKPNPAVITTLRPDGQPVSVATWYLMDGDRVLVNMDESRKRLEYMRHDPRVTITVLDRDGWDTHVSMQGRATDIRDDEDKSGIDRLCMRYSGQPFPNHERGRVNAWIDVERWHGWGDITNEPATD